MFGATGVVGFASAVIAAAEGAKTVLIGYDGADRVKALAELAKERFKVELAYADGSSEALKEQAIKDVDVDPGGRARGRADRERGATGEGAWR